MVREIAELFLRLQARDYCDFCSGFWIDPLVQIQMEIDQQSKFAIHEAAREGKSKPWGSVLLRPR